jgi:hypothetical protein
MDAAVAGLTGACIGAMAGIAGSVITTIITKRSEERRHRREVVLRTALESWRESVAFGKFRIEHGESVSIFPLESHIIPMGKIADMLERENLDEQAARRCVREFIALNDAVGDEFRRHHQERKQARQTEQSQ